MSTLGSIMLGTTDPDRLHRWYTTALPPDTDSREGDYRILGYGGFYLFIDGRDDVQATHPDPARTLLNFDVEDASGVAQRLDDLGATWVAPLEDRAGSLFATAQDPDGNYLQLIQLSPEHRAAMADQDSGTTAVAGLQPSEAFGGFSVDDLDAARADRARDHLRALRRYGAGRARHPPRRRPADRLVHRPGRQRALGDQAGLTARHTDGPDHPTGRAVCGVGGLFRAEDAASGASGQERVSPAPGPGWWWR